MTEAPVAQIVLMGVAGSGKSTIGAMLAERLGCEMAEADDFHSPANVAKMKAGIPLQDADRWPWLRDIAAWIAERDRSSLTAVVTCSALKRAYRDVLRAASPRVAFVHLAGRPELIFDRMRHRAGHFMPTSLLDSQYAILEPLGPDERGITVDVSRSIDEIVETVISVVALALVLVLGAIV
ncbi:MAG TPA: gluconokinase [Anaeromyxobacteraceae bacterium]